MAQVRFPVRLFGYDRKAVSAVLASTEDQLRRAETRRDELLSATANVERVGAQVADVLRTLADRVVELEGEAAAKAADVVHGARRDADVIRAEAAAVLASAEAQAEQLLESARRQQSSIAEQRETALISLQIAIDQMGRLASTVHQIDLTAAEAVAPPAPREESESAPGTFGQGAGAPLHLDVVAVDEGVEAAEGPSASVTIDDPIAPALARIDAWVRTS